jgi:replication factor C subunit 1
MNNYDLWINKYKPSNISDIIGNTAQITKFKNWLENLLSSKYQGIIISGNQGLGKTLTVRLILENLGYIVKIINPNEIKDHRIYDNFNDYYNFNNSIYSKIHFNNNKNKKIALIFDETENITLTSEKKYILDIYKENNKLKNFPIIFISNNQHSKLLNELKKGCQEIIFTNPSNHELKNLIKNICSKENIYFEYDELIDKLILFSQNDIRRLINLLQELSFHIKNNIKKITENNVNEFIEKSRNKNIDIGLFESTERILNNYLDYDTIIKLYESEKVLLPLMIHENYLKKILNKSKNQLPIYNMVKITDSISRGDNIETSIYTDQNWYLQNIHGFFSCINTSYWINKNDDNKIKSEDIKFSSDLNKTSLKNINRKNIMNLSKVISNKSNQEILMLNKICNHLIESGNENKLIDILNGYNKDISIKEIELCLKIDKTTDFNILASKDKKRITKQMKI